MRISSKEALAMVNGVTANRTFIHCFSPLKNRFFGPIGVGPVSVVFATNRDRADKVVIIRFYGCDFNSFDHFPFMQS
jgi:hypothetical protein